MGFDKDNPSEEIRYHILNAALKHVPFDGWTTISLQQAVKDLDLPKGAEELYFPGGPLELIDFWAETSDIEALEKIGGKGLDNMRIRDKITECVWIKVSLLAGNEASAMRAISRLTLPDAVGQAPKHLWRTSDMIWRAIGDTSTDGNFYSKRTILSGVLASTTMSWLSDETSDKFKTRAFLDARISNVMQFEKVKAGLRKSRQNLPDPVGMIGRLRYGRRRRRRR